MYKLATFGNFQEKGYISEVFLLYPRYRKGTTHSLNRTETTVKELELSTRYRLTTNKFYVKIEVAILGFGISLSIHTRSDI